MYPEIMIIPMREELTRAGHTVLIETGAGQGSGISDEQYAANGAEYSAIPGFPLPFLLSATSP